MGKNKSIGGKKYKRGKRLTEDKRELPFKEEDQQYAKVTKMLGNGRVEAECTDGISRMCKIRGNMRKKVWINPGDVVLVSLREYQDDKADILFRYTPDETRALRRYGEISMDAFGGNKECSDDDDDYVDFDDEEEFDIGDI